MRFLPVAMLLLAPVASWGQDHDRDGAAKRVEAFFTQGDGTTLAGEEDTATGFVELIGKATKAESDHVLVDISLGEGGPVVFEVARKDVVDILPVGKGTELKRVRIRTYERAEEGLRTVSVRLHHTTDLASLTASTSDGTDLAGSDEGEKRDDIKARFSGAGGHVYIEGPDVVPQLAEARAAVHTPDLIRWVLEHKGVNVVEGDFELGHKTVQNWTHIRIPFDGRRKIRLPNTFIGYLGWKP